jgi:8-oxo-dGTP pyrophosphatase MutT (NUDIX family)
MYKTISAKVVYQCPIFNVEERVVQYENGHTSTHWVVIRNPNVMVIALTPDQQIVFINEVRGEEMKFDLPGGKIMNFAPTESEVLSQAKAELHEEAGFEAGQLEIVHVQHENSNWLERVFNYVAAWDLKEVGTQLEAGEQITTSPLSITEVEDRLNNHKFPVYFEEPLKLSLELFRSKNLIN